jgi:rhodanese-related sulfurtransferase
MHRADAARLLALSLLVAVAFGVHAADDALSCPAGASGLEGAPRERAYEMRFTRPESSVPAAKRTIRGLYLTARDAYEMIEEDPAKVLFVDVRTRGELQFIGAAASIDVNVPYMIEAEPPQWDDATSAPRLVVNPRFVARVGQRIAKKGLGMDAPIILICQAGVRAARAADALTRAGFANAYAVIDGFEGDAVTEGPGRGLRLVNGWRNAGLPWSTRLDRSRIDGFE